MHLYLKVMKKIEIMFYVKSVICWTNKNAGFSNKLQNTTIFNDRAWPPKNKKNNNKKNK